ncbi:tripartite tricarboxylate transporter substrate binding protein [Pigmentiphaga sp. YJ18]|uniref:Bug family tripartite tricarboxylate transporter substrate binding protein n=1 Tax=Pigmentiphaga sp. YJ18 TaxID=3134907 RepID=UPI00311166C7
MKHVYGAAAVLLACCISAPAVAADADYPNRPVRIVVTTPPGGAVDVLGRLMAGELTKKLGQTVFVENRGGANGNIAGEFVARAPADGYTLLQTSGGMLTTNPHLYRSMAFDPLKDFTPITQVALNPLWLVVRAGLPVDTVTEFVAYLKAHPNTVTYSSAGSGSALHMAQAEFARATGVTARHIPYKGAGQALQDVIAGQVDFTWDPGPALQHRSSGKIKIIAVGMPKRSSAAPDVPTVAESGYPGLNTASAHALLAPAGTPRDIVNRLNKAAVEILGNPDVAQRIRAMGIEPIGNSPERAAADIRRESEHYKQLIREANISVE